MKVVNLAYDDYANLMHGHTNALRSVGVDVQECKLKEHQFGYATQAPVVKPSDIMRAIRGADVINIYHSAKPIANLVQASGIRGKRVTVWHTGSEYRANPELVKKTFEHIGVKKEFTDQCEFLKIDQNLDYVTAAMDVSNLLKIVNPMGCDTLYGSKKVFGHYPSKASIKGSDEINRMMSLHADVIYHYSDEKANHRDQLFRMYRCDCYIELFKLELEGKPYGCHGVTAFEASAMGIPTITQNIHMPAYEKVYGTSPLMLAHTEDEFHAHIDRIKSMPIVQFKNLRREFHQWIVGKHSLEAIGKQIKKSLIQL